VWCAENLEWTWLVLVQIKQRARTGRLSLFPFLYNYTSDINNYNLLDTFYFMAFFEFQLIGVIFFSCFYCTEWGYIVTFTALTICQIHHSWIHPHSPLLPSPIPKIVSSVLIFPFTYMCTQYLHHTHLPSLFPLVFSDFLKKVFTVCFSVIWGPWSWLSWT
jgi:hypothetical protein